MQKTNKLTLIVWSIEAEYSLSFRETNETTGNICPVREVAGSNVLVVGLNFHAKMVPSCNIESEKTNQESYII